MTGRALGIKLHRLSLLRDPHLVPTRRHFFQRAPTNRKQAVKSKPSATLVSAAVLSAQAPPSNACSISARAPCALIAYYARSDPRISQTSTRRDTQHVHVLLCVWCRWFPWPFISLLSHYLVVPRSARRKLSLTCDGNFHLPEGKD